MNDTELILRGGDVIVLPPGEAAPEMQYYTCRADAYTIVAEPGARTLAGLSDELSKELYERLCGMANICYTVPPELLRLAADAYTSYKESSDLLSVCMLASLMSRLLIEAVPWHERVYPPAIRQAMDYINTNIYERLELADTAKRCGMSLSYFKASFTRATGMTPLYYVRWRKTAIAKRLIANGYSVTAAAEMLSFNTPAYFSTVFRTMTGLTPMEYRALTQKAILGQRNLHLYNDMMHKGE